MSFIKQAIAKGVKAFSQLAKKHHRPQQIGATAGPSQERRKATPKAYEEVLECGTGFASPGAAIEYEQEGHAPETSH